MHSTVPVAVWVQVPPGTLALRKVAPAATGSVRTIPRASEGPALAIRAV